MIRRELHAGLDPYLQKVHTLGFGRIEVRILPFSLLFGQPHYKPALKANKAPPAEPDSPTDYSH